MRQVDDITTGIVGSRCIHRNGSGVRAASRSILFKVPIMYGEPT